MSELSRGELGARVRLLSECIARYGPVHYLCSGPSMSYSLSFEALCRLITLDLT